MLTDCKKSTKKEDRDSAKQAQELSWELELNRCFITACLRPTEASGSSTKPPCRALVCPHRYDLASERSDPVRPPVPIRQKPRQHFLVDPLARGPVLDNDADEVLGFLDLV